MHQGALALTRGAHLRVQLQLSDHGDRAADVAVWLNENYPHLSTEAWSQPGLCVTMAVPRHSLDSLEGWIAAFHEATGPLDIAFEILSHCFAELGLPPGQVLSLHLTE